MSQFLVELLNVRNGAAVGPEKASGYTLHEYEIVSARDREGRHGRDCEYAFESRLAIEV